MERKFYCQYVAGASDDHGTEALYLYLPTGQGYMQYSVVHSVIPSKQCDTWRFGPLYYCDCAFRRITRLTRERAEWEMAIRLSGRPDFIGGVAHGDEVYERISVCTDGQERPLSSLAERPAVTSVTVEIASVGFDPSEPTRPVLRHGKRIDVSADRLCVDQRVEWLADVPLGQSYMAMMPPLKTVTDRYRFGAGDFLPIVERSFGGRGDACELTLCGESGFFFSMAAQRYPYEHGERNYLISDNGADQYHKMYFVMPHGGEVAAGEIWETRTVYRAAYAPALRGGSPFESSEGEKKA